MVDRNAFADAVQSVFGIEQISTECFTAAFATAHALTMLGEKARPMFGYAMWAVGTGPFDCIGHHPSSVNMGFSGATLCGNCIKFEHIGHGWVVTDKHLVDMTTISLGLKLRRQDAFDGFQSSIEWEPRYLWVPKFRVNSHYKKFVNSRGAGHIPESVLDHA